MTPSTTQAPAALTGTEGTQTACGTRRRVKRSLALKLLFVLLVISALTLLCCAVIAIRSMKELGRFAIESNMALGNYAVSNATTALTGVAEEDLSRLARNQAAISDAVFKRVQIDVDVMAAFASALWTGPTNAVPDRSYSMSERPDDVRKCSVYVLAPGVTDSSIRDELDLSVEMDHLFMPICSNDTVFLSAGVGSERGAYRAYPWRNTYKQGYDPRKRDWYRSASEKGGTVWTLPYVSASMTRLIVSCSKPFYGSDGKLLGVVQVDITPKTINENIINTRIGKSGYAFLIDGAGNEIAAPGSGFADIVVDKDYHPRNLLTSAEAGLRDVVVRMTRKETGVARCFFDNAERYVAFAPVPTTGWSIGIVMPVDEIVAAARDVDRMLSSETRTGSQRIDDSISMALRLLLASFAMMLVVVALVAMQVSRRITKPIRDLGNGTALIGGGNLDHRLDIKTDDEIECLAEDFNKMAGNLKTYISNLRETTAAKERIESELQIARKIQTSILPRFFPPFPDRHEFDLHARMDPAREVGGDFFDFFMIDENRLCIAIGDVSDKGIPASLFMAVTKTLIKTEALQQGRTAAEILSRVNNQLCQENEMLMFVTVFCVILDVRTGEFEFANGGHNPPVLCRNGAGAAFMNPGKGIALAVMENAPFNLGRDRLNPGDVLFLYTDGINEAMSGNREQFSYDRLLSSLDESKTQGMKDLINHMSDRIKAFVGEAPQSDDVTMVSLRFLGPSGIDGRRAK